MSRTWPACLLPRLREGCVGLCLLALSALGCDTDSGAGGRPSGKKIGDSRPSASARAEAGAPAPAAGEGKPVEVKRIPLSKTDKNVWLEIQGKERRVGVACLVCLRKGGFGLECLLCRKGTKEHESILVTDADARLIHAGLEAAGARPGSAVEYEPRFKPPSGQRIRLTLEFEHKGKLIRVPAQQWVRHVKARKDLQQEWVFVGSKLIPNPEDPKKPPLYLAQSDGAFIAISNVPTAMLDLPIDSPKGLEDRGFDTNERRIPPLGTKVTLLLQPIPEKQKADPIPEKYAGPLFEAEPGGE